MPNWGVKTDKSSAVVLIVVAVIFSAINDAISEINAMITLKPQADMMKRSQPSNNQDKNGIASEKTNIGASPMANMNMNSAMINVNKINMVAKTPAMKVKPRAAKSTSMLKKSVERKLLSVQASEE